MKADQWMPLYPGDYLRDTGHLTTAEHGAYLLLLMQAWTRGGALPADDDRLRALARMDRREWAKARETVLAFFQAGPDGLIRNPRLEIELSRAKTISERRQDAGRSGAEKRWKINSDNMAKPLPAPMANASQNDGQPQPHLQDKTPSPSKNEGEGEGKAPAGASPALPSDEKADPPADEAKAAKVKTVPPHPPMAVLNDMAAVWNEFAAEHGLAQVQKITEQRAIHLRARCRERWTGDPVRQFRAYVARICKSPFLRGENDRGWKADFDWAVQPGNVVKVAEGKYHDGDGEDV